MLLAALLLAQVPALADLAVPGHRDIDHELVVTWEEGVAGDRLLVAAPVRGFGGATVILPGVPFTFSTKYGTRLFALPADTALPERVGAEDWRAWLDAHPSSAPPVTEIRNVAWSHPVDRILSTLSLDEVSLDPPGLTLSVVRHERFDAEGRSLGDTDPRYLVVLLSTAGLLGLVWTARGRGAGGAP